MTAENDHTNNSEEDKVEYDQWNVAKALSALQEEDERLVEGLLSQWLLRTTSTTILGHRVLIQSSAWISLLNIICMYHIYYYVMNVMLMIKILKIQPTTWQNNVRGKLFNSKEKEGLCGQNERMQKN